MAHDIKVSVEAANIKAAAWGSAMNSGAMLIFDGAKPKTGNDPVSGATLLGVLTFGNPAFKPPVNGQIESNPITKDSDASNTGRAKFYRLVRSGGKIPMGDGTCGEVGSGSDVELENTSITQHGEITCSGFSHQENLG